MAEAILKKRSLLERIVSLVGKSELSSEDQVIYKRARMLENYMTQDFYSVQKETGRSGVYFPLKQTVEDVTSIVNGKMDTVAEENLLYLISGLVKQ